MFPKVPSLVITSWNIPFYFPSFFLFLLPLSLSLPPPSSLCASGFPEHTSRIRLRFLPLVFSVFHSPCDTRASPWGVVRSRTYANYGRQAASQSSLSSFPRAQLNCRPLVNLAGWINDYILCWNWVKNRGFLALWCFCAVSLFWVIVLCLLRYLAILLTPSD